MQIKPDARPELLTALRENYRYGDCYLPDPRYEPLLTPTVTAFDLSAWFREHAVKSPAGLPYLDKCYGYPCIRSALDAAQREYERIHPPAARPLHPDRGRRRGASAAHGGGQTAVRRLSPRNAFQAIARPHKSTEVCINRPKSAKRSE